MMMFFKKIRDVLLKFSSELSASILFTLRVFAAAGWHMVRDAQSFLSSVRRAKFKDIPYYLAIGSLTLGASLILGLLSFGGMFALWPILPLAFAAFTLSVAYEGEIYLQNIKGAWNKLFKPNYLKQSLANDYLRTHFPEHVIKNRPQFFNDYEKQLRLYHKKFAHKQLDAAGLIEKEVAEETLGHLNQWFASQLFVSEKKTPLSLNERPIHIIDQKIYRRPRNLIDTVYADSYVFNKQDNQLYQVDATGFLLVMTADTKAERVFSMSNVIHMATEFEEMRQFLKYEVELQTWLSGCDVHVISNQVKDNLNNKTYINAYVFNQDDNTLHYVDENGQSELITLVEQQVEQFKTNLLTVMKGNTYQRLTRKQIDAINAGENGQPPLTSMVDEQTRQQRLFKRRHRAFQLARVGSLLASVFMSLGTTYLLVEAFTVIPWLASLPLLMWPMLIVPMAIIAGTAYGLLTYNAITDMITNDTIRAWYKRLRHDLSQGVTLRNVFMAAMAIVLFTLTLALTICTAGTWWTIAKQTRPLFVWMSKMPSLIMQVVTPLVLGSTTMVFNLENTFETLDLVDQATKGEGYSFAQFIQSIRDGIEYLRAHENAWQWFNPFRIILKLTVTPLRILLFLGHLIAIGVTADRFPGVPEIVSALLGILSEGFEDAHYFVEGAHQVHGHDMRSLLDEHLGSEHGHNHDLDIPTRILKAIFYPIYCLAAIWDVHASQLNNGNNHATRPVLDYKAALQKQMGLEPEEHVTVAEHQVLLSSAGEKHYIDHLLACQSEKLAQAQIGQEVAGKKRAALNLLRNDIRQMDHQQVGVRLVSERQCPDYKIHRTTPSFFAKHVETDTEAFINNIQKRSESPVSVTDDMEALVENCGPNCIHVPRFV